MSGRAFIAAVLFLALLFTACIQKLDGRGAMAAPKRYSGDIEDGGSKSIAVDITTGGRVFSARFCDTPSARTLLEQMPFTINMNDYARQEKVLELPYNFPEADTMQPDIIRSGELFLWSGNRLVLFYTTFSNAYGGFVPIGRIDDVEGLMEALGRGSVAVTYSRAVQPRSGETPGAASGL